MKTNWKKVKLKDAFTQVRNGKSIKQDGESGIPITRIETIANETVDENKFGYADINNIEEYKDWYLKDGDILMSHINSQKHLGKTAIYTGQPDILIHGMNLICLRPNQNQIDPRYALYYFKSKMFLNQIPKISNQSVNQSSFSVTKLKDVIEIPLPPLDIQKKVAEALDKADAIRRKRQEAIDKLDELVQSVFLDMFGDPVKNEKGWEITSLADFGNFKNGLNYSKSESGYEILTLGVGDFKDKSVLNDTNMLQKLNLNEVPSEGYFLKDGDIVFVRSNGNRELVGRSMAVYPGKEKVTYSGFCIRYRIEKELYEPLFLTYLFKNKHFKKSMLKNGRGANIQNINQKLLSALKVPTPPMKEQIVFVDCVRKIRDIRISQNSTLRYTNNLFNALMQKAFKGEMEFRNI